MTFTAKVEGIESNKIKYKWTVSTGEIASGQETSTITVATNLDLSGQTINTTVEVSGLPQGCLNEASVTGEIGCGLTRPSKLIDRFSLNSSRIKKESLEFIKIELEIDPTAKAYIFESFKTGTSSEIIKKKITNTFAYFIQNAKISPERTIIQVSESSENLTQLWIVPAGANTPENKSKFEINGKDFQKQLEELFPKTKKKR